MAERLRVILGVFLVTAAVVVGSTLITFWFGNRVLKVRAREQARRDGITRLEQLESVLKDAETGQRGFIITGDENYLRPFNQATERLPADLENCPRSQRRYHSGGSRESDDPDSAQNGGVEFDH